MSIRAAMRKHSVSYPTVTKAMASAWPEPRKKPSARPTRLDVYKPLIDAMLANGRGGAAGRDPRRTAPPRAVGRQAAGASSAAWSAAHCASVRPFLPVTCSNVGETAGGSSAYSAW